MNRQQHIIINFAGFQLGWFACVLMAAQNQPVAGIAVAMFVIAVHFVVIKQRLSSLRILIAVTLLGGSWDSMLTSMHILVFNAGSIHPNLAPGWIIVMWMLFATTLNVSLRWLYGRYLLAMLLGAIAGPLAYRAGELLGAVTIPNTSLATITLSIGWAVILPLLIFIAEKSEMPVKKQVLADEY